MEAITHQPVDVMNVMHWEGIDFEFLEPEIRFDRSVIRLEREKQKPHLTAKQKRLMEAERYTHTLP